MILDQPLVTSFTRFAEDAEPRVRRALTAAFGFETGQEAAADALAYAWEHWDRIHDMDNPVGYVFRVGQRLAKRAKRRRAPAAAMVAPPEEPWIEPELGAALSRLSGRQRMVVALVHGFDWSMAEVGEMLGISKASVQVHERRAMKALRRQLGVER